jgi:hypothetical protein
VAHHLGLLRLDGHHDRRVAVQPDLGVLDLELLVLQVATVPAGPLLLVEHESDGAHPGEIRCE